MEGTGDFQLRKRSDIITEIECERTKLAGLRCQLNETAARMDSLHKELNSLPKEQIILAEGHPSEYASVPLTNAEKVALFRSLFRGREDVFPRRWENSRTAKSGYSPVCVNEWEYGLCEKKKRAVIGRRATCGECPNQAFLPVTDEEIAKHLQGIQIMGVYPMLPNETCWFMAADFDKDSWMEDIAAFMETCGEYAVPIAIERSRSGNGAHAWLFFDAPVMASAARKLGCFLITETMTRRHQLSMDSYDRLFPNQDTMPKGGFGNLIALPLQRAARDVGNSVFIDTEFNPLPDQWRYLASIEQLSASSVLSRAEEADRRGEVIGVRMSDTVDEEELTPWNRPPSGRPRKIVLREPLPPMVHAILSQRLFINKEGLPSPILNQLKRLAAFQNPEFYKKQRMRLSTALTPRVIACAEDHPEHIALPRGCRNEAEELLRAHGSNLIFEDRRSDGAVLDVGFHGTLTPLQEQAVHALLGQDIGVLVAPPGIGKTVVGTYLIAARRRSTLILVHRKPLLDQWIAQLSIFLGIEPKAVGQIGAGKWKPNGLLDVAMVQSLVRKGEVNDLVAGYGQVIEDEVHHAPAFSFERVMTEVKARYVVGLTATPHRRDGHHPIIHMQFGPVRFAVDPKNRAARRPYDHRLIVRETDFDEASIHEGAGIQEVYAVLTADQRRNELILNDVLCALQEKRSPIMLTERRDHLEYFANRLRGLTRNLVVLHGGMKPKERREAFAQLAAIPDSEERLIIATGRYIGEGFDDARLDTLFLALPVSWKGTLIQYTGRLHRLHPGKTEVRIYDYVDRAVPVLFKMFKKRLRGYRAIGYTRDGLWEGDGMFPGEMTTESGGDAIRR